MANYPRNLKGLFDDQGNPIKADKAGETATPIVPEPVQENATPEPVNAEPEVTGERPNPVGDVPTHDTSTDPVNPETPSPAKTADENFKAMQGRYKAEIAKLKEEREKAQQLIDLLVAEKRNAPPAPSVAPAVAPQAPEPEIPDLTDEERAMYGDFAPIAEKLIARATAPLRKEINELKQEQSNGLQGMGKLDESLFVRDVGARVTDMQSICNSPEWREYLAQRVPLTRMSVEDALKAAHGSRDLSGVVEIFNTFKAEQAKRHPATATPAAAEPSPAPTSGLANLVTPARSAANAATKKSFKYTQADYDQMFEKMVRNQIPKEEFNVFSKEFDDARKKGLVGP